MSQRQMNVANTFFLNGILRHIFMESLASSPTAISNSSLSSSNSNDISIETCIDYLQSHLTPTLPNDALDKLKNLLNGVTTNGRIDWKMFKTVAQNWIASIESQYQDGNNNLNKLTNDDTTSNSDGGTVESVGNIFDDSAKRNELVEWSIIPKNRMDNDITNDYDKTNVLIKLPGQTNSTAEVELRLRIRRLDEDNIWLRDELERIEELAGNYQRKFYSLRQRLDHVSEKCNQLERENEEQKEMIVNMEDAERRCVIAMEKAEKERKSYIDKLEIQKNFISSLNEKIDKLRNEKKNCLIQLNTCRTKLKEREIMCDVLQEKNDQMIELNSDLEQYYEKTVRNLTERSDDLKNENVKLYSKMSSGHQSLDLNVSSTGIYLNSSLENLSHDDQKIHTQNSLYDELKATGFSFEEGQDNLKIRQLEEELDWYNEEINNANKKLDEIIQQLGRESESHNRKYFSDTSGYQTRYILILLDKITLVSDAVTERFCKPSTSETSVQVSAEPLTNQLNKFNILKFEDGLIAPIVKKDPASGDSFNINFTIGQIQIEKLCNNDINPKNIYTCTDKLNRRQWGRKFNSIAIGTPSGDAPINGNSSPSLHSNTEHESKIILRTAMNIDDDISWVNDAISPNSQKQINSENLYCESLPENLSLSPICGMPNMMEKPVPKRKKSVYLRTHEIEEIFNTPDVINERIASSTPTPDDNFNVNSHRNFVSTEYRTVKNCSDSSESFSMSKLDSFIEEDTSNNEILVTNDQSIFIAPSKLNLGIEREIKNLNVRCPVEQNSMSSIVIKDTLPTILQSNMGISDNSHEDKDKLIKSSQLSCIDNINNNFHGDSHAKNSTKPIDLTCTSQSDVNSTSQRVSDDRSERAASKILVIESTSVASAMSSDDDSSDLSDNDATTNCNIENNNKSNVIQKSLNDKCVKCEIQSNDNSTHTVSITFENNLPTFTNEFNNTEAIASKATCKYEIVPAMKRSRSESECLVGNSREENCSVCSIDTPKTNSNDGEFKSMAFPSLSDTRLLKAGIANVSNNNDLEINNLDEDELARKFTAFSLGLCIDRLTLSRRRALSIRQRDQTERNFVGELTKMQQNIQDLATLCFDSVTIERIERARNQVDVIAQCAHKISCTAETLGAIQQEYRLSRAVNLADRYLRILRNRCEKLVIDLAETKRILMEHNIIIDEHTGECSEELTALRYRGLTNNNRTMAAKRRASIATIFRPMVTGQDTVKDGVRQRNSVSGRVTIRRPSFSTDTQRWETEKLNRTESSSSVGELREIFEHTESRRTSREENNNIMRMSINICESEEIDSKALEIVAHDGDEMTIGATTDDEFQPASRRISRLILGPGNYLISWRLMFWCIMISFFIGFYVKDAVSSGPCIGTPFKWWSIEEIIDRHIEIRNTAPRPI